MYYAVAVLRSVYLEPFVIVASAPNSREDHDSSEKQWITQRIVFRDVSRDGNRDFHYGYNVQKS